MRTIHWLLATAGSAVYACSGSYRDNNSADHGATDETGSVEVALTNIPSDVACVKIGVTGSRPQTKLLDVTPGSSSTYVLNRLPLGIITVSGEAYLQPCNAVTPAAVPSYVSDQPVTVRVDAADVNQITLNLIRNGRISVGIDFEQGPQPYIVPVAAGVKVKALLNVGDSVNGKADGGAYRFAGIPDGLGGFDNGDGTFTLLMNHEMSPGSGAIHAHGANGAFVSRWTIRKSDLTTLGIQDLTQTVTTWNATSSSYQASPAPVAFTRFCSADLAPISAFYDAASGLGYNGRLFLNGEEGGSGRAWAHALDGTSYELPRLGKQAWENQLAHPNAGAQTIVVGTDDSSPLGQVFVYVGTKTNAGNAVQRAGLANGTLYGVSVTGVASEAVATGIPSGSAFTLASLGNVENSTMAQLDAALGPAALTGFRRPEDGSWDPVHPTDFYFVTTHAFDQPSRLFRLRFNDLTNPAAGGTLDMLLNGTEGQKMLDNLTVDKKGHIYLTEDVGGNAHLGKVWRYDLATGTFTAITQSNPALFTPGAAQFLTQDEEASGIIDAADIIGPGWFLVDVQAHYATDAELVEGGQLLAIYDPAAL